MFIGHFAPALIAATQGVTLAQAVGAFVLAGLCALAVDATKPVSREPGAAA